MINGAAIAEDARRYLGASYQLGGRSRDAFDCVGLVLHVANDFGFNWQCETPVQLDSDGGGISWGNVDQALRKFDFRHVPVTEIQLGDVLIHRVPLGGAATVKIVSGLGGYTSFFGVSRLINFLEPTNLVETVLTSRDMVAIKQDTGLTMQDYVKRLWSMYRYPFVTG